MPYLRSFFIVFVLATLGCSQLRITEPLKNRPSASPWPTDWSAHLGQEITLEGTAADDKLGAMLLDGACPIWIDGLRWWPEGYYQSDDKGKRVRVTGTLIVKHDLPVFIQKPGELPRAGIPVPEDTDLHEASKRYLLKDARWEVLE